MTNKTTLEPALENLLNKIITDLDTRLAELGEPEVQESELVIPEGMELTPTHNEQGEPYVVITSERELEILTAAMGSTTLVALAHTMGQLGFDEPTEAEVDGLFAQLAEYFNL